MKGTAVRVFLLVEIYSFGLLVKRCDAVSQPGMLEISADSQIPPSVHPLESRSHLLAPVCYRDVLITCPAFQLIPHSPLNTYTAVGELKSLRRENVTFSSLRGGSIALGLLPLFRRDTDLGVNLGTSSYWMHYFTSLGLRFFIYKMIIISALQGCDKNYIY